MKILRMALSSLITVMLVWAFAGVKVAKVTQPDPAQIPSFVGYAPNKIVLKLSDKIVLKLSDDFLKKIDQRLMARGRLGIPALDNVLETYDARRIIKQFPNAIKKVYQGRVINLAAWHKVYFTKTDTRRGGCSAHRYSHRVCCTE